MEMTEVPAWPTTMRSRLADGRLMGTDGSVWLWRKVPMSPVLDAKSPTDALMAAEPLLAAYEELAAMTGVNIARRALAKGSYRQTHALLVNVPQFFTPDREHPNAEYLRQSFGATPIDRRLLLFGVRLQDKVGGGSGGLKAAIDSVVETIVSGTTPLSDFDADSESVSAALERAGLVLPSADEIRLANAWWNHGDYPDTPLLVHSDHLHIFESAEAVGVAEAAGVDQCHTWSEVGVPGQHSISFASVQDLDLPFIEPEDPTAAWVADLVTAGALVVSIRGNVEPGNVTRQELRRQRKRFIDDINERAKSGKMERAEQEETLALLSAVESMYAVGGNAPPTLAGASIIVGFDGQVGDINQVLRPGSPVKLALMAFRQPNAMAETMLCSNIRANPNLQDLPTQAVACSGMPSLNSVGDREGALVGFTERDRQPAYLSPSAASTSDGLPMMLVAGATGSGKTVFLLDSADQFARMNRPVVIIDPKALALDTRVPTPSGWSTIGEIAVGDRVLARDGHPCTVTHISRTFSAGETRLFEFVFDDGQVIKADANHQWVAYSPNDRRRYQAATAAEIAAWKPQHLAWAEAVYRLSSEVGDAATVGTYALIEMLTARGVTKWTDGKTLAETLRAAGVHSGRAVKPLTWPASTALKALADALVRDADSPFGRTVTTEEMLAAGVQRSGQTRWAVPVAAAVEAPVADLPIDPYLFGVWLGDGTATCNAITCGNDDLAAMETLIQVAWPVTHRYAQSETVTSVVLDRDFAVCLYGHDDYVEVNHGKRGMVQRCATCERGHQKAYRLGEKRQAPEMVNPTFIHLLRQIGVYRDKHIPMTYLRASRAQRLALLQGLMDTDGTVKKRGDLRITMTNERLMRDVYELVQSLGWKATFWEGGATITEPDPERPGSKRTRVVGPEWVVTFRADETVFRLPQKMKDQHDRCAGTIAPRSMWRYVTEIREIPAQEARCLRVDSADHTYLVGDFVVTHNTGSDHSPVVLAAGGQVASLDRLLAADGIFDPLRFSASKEVGVELASSMLMSINPWGQQKDDMEVPLQHALAYGASNGAECIGQALVIAKRDLALPEGMVERVEALASSSPMFRAIVGVNPTTEGLRAASGITLIKVGDAYLDLPEPGVPPASITQRIALALVRMMVFGSAMALTNRGGAVMLDEAWVFLGAGRSEVERLGRLARSQQVLPMLFTQRVTDALNAGLAGYISRGLILPIEDSTEAAAACELFKLEPTHERMARITAKATMGSAGGGTAPNWNSMRALRDPRTNAVLRGSIGIYADLAGRAIPVEVTLSKEFLDLASTNPEDIRRRQEEAARKAALLSQAQEQALTDTGPDSGGAVLDKVF